jgi:RNA exonuclease 4
MEHGKPTAAQRLPGKYDDMALELSSNWKRLQGQLKHESKSSRENKKRKAARTVRQQDTIAKRMRLQGSAAKAPLRGPEKKSNMGSWMSMQTEEPMEPTRSTSLALWAEDNDISAKDLEEAYGGGMRDAVIQEAKLDSINGGLSKDVDLGKYVGIDCEMVGVGGDEDRSVLARVSIVNFHGTQIYDSFVRPKEYVTDWRTHVSGVTPKHMATARSFEEVQTDVAAILKGRIIVGHAIKNDLEAMILEHPKKDIRDTSKFSGFRKYSAGRAPSLKKLAKEVLGVDIQDGEHSSIEDARATMLLFRRHKPAFDAEHATRFPAYAPGSGVKRQKKKKKGRR